MTHQASMEYLIKCKENRELTIDSLTNKIDKLNKMLIEVKKEHSDLVDEINKKQQAEQVEKGRLAEVSMYEFVNDWVRPEISWKIFSYLAEDPHKEGVKKSQDVRRVFKPSKRWLDNGRGLNPNFKYGCGKWVDDTDEEPYSEIWWWKDIGKPFYNDRGGRSIPMFEDWVDSYSADKLNPDHVVSRNCLRFTNPLLAELWSFHSWLWNSNGNKRFRISKKEVKEYLKMNKVKGRGKLTFGVLCSDNWGDISAIHKGEGCYIPSEHRRELVGALMKI